MFQYFKSKAANVKRIQIGLAGSNAQTRKALQDMLEANGDIAVTAIRSEAVTAKTPPVGANVIVYELDAASESAQQEFKRFMMERPPGLPVVAITTSIDEELVRWFLQLRVSDWLKSPFTSGELVAACGRAISHLNPARADQKCLAFMGARGGVGTTTVAVHAALASSKDGAGSLCLIDLDLATGACADYLDLTPAWQFDELIGNPERLDAHMFSGMLAKHASGLSVLSAQRKFGAAQEFAEEAVTLPLNMAAQKFSTLMIDVPRSAERLAGSVIGGASAVFVVTEFTVPGLKSARRMVNDLLELHGPELKVKVIVNKYVRHLFGSNLSQTEAKELLGPFLAGFVANDPKLAAEAVNRGIPTTEIKRRNAIFLDVKKAIGDVA